MKKQHRPRVVGSNEKKSAESNKSGFSPWPMVVFLVGAGALVWLIRDSFVVPSSFAPTTMTNQATATSSQLPAVATNRTGAEPPQPLPAAARQKLLGNWQRTDADYAIEIRLVNADGTADARYFNPFNQRSINVAKATVAEQGGKAEFFMELRDVGYPGSTYTLRYDEREDLLTGVYFQAAAQQSFDVSFQRLRGK